MLIRAERSGDVDRITTVVADAFSLPGGGAIPEVGLVSALRDSDSWIPQLSLVAVVDDLVVAHCLSTRGHVGDFPVLALGPISVAGSYQRRGIGSALMRATIDIAGEMSETLIGLLGDPHFYGRFGFAPAADEGVESPNPSWGRYFQVKRLSSRVRPAGLFRYPAAFRAVT